MLGWDFAHVQGDVNPHILCMLEGTFFSLDAAHTVPWKALFRGCGLSWKPPYFLSDQLCRRKKQG